MPLLSRLYSHGHRGSVVNKKNLSISIAFDLPFMSFLTRLSGSQPSSINIWNLSVGCLGLIVFP